MIVAEALEEKLTIVAPDRAFRACSAPLLAA